MAVTTLSSREFNQDAGRAKKAALTGPVFITDRGRPAHVLLSIEDYWALTGAAGDLVDRLSMPGGEGAEFEAPKANIGLQPPDFR